MHLENAVKELMFSLDLVMHKYDPGLFLMFNEDVHSVGFMFVHADDFFYGGLEWFHAKVIVSFEKVFPVGAKHKYNFLYLGMMIESIYENGKIKEILVDQVEYTAVLTPIPVDKNARPPHTTPELHSKYQTLVGGMSWVVTQSRPDLAFDVSSLSGSVASPLVEDLFRANKFLTRMQRTVIRLRLPLLRGELSLIGF